LVLVEYRTSLTVHHLSGTNDIAAKRLADRLMPEADTQEQQPAGVMLDGLDGDPRFGWRTGAWGDYDSLRLVAIDLGDGQFVVAHHFDFGTQLAEVLHNVVGKRVVVIDHQQHGMNLLNSLT